MGGRRPVTHPGARRAARRVQHVLQWAGDADFASPSSSRWASSRSASSACGPRRSSRSSSASGSAPRPPRDRRARSGVDPDGSLPSRPVRAGSPAPHGAGSLTADERSSRPERAGTPTRCPSGARGCRGAPRRRARGTLTVDGDPGARRVAATGLERMSQVPSRSRDAVGMPYSCRRDALLMRYGVQIHAQPRDTERNLRTSRGRRIIAAAYRASG